MNKEQNNRVKKILFIDDDKFLRDMYKLKLEKASFNVDTLEDANGDFVDRIVNIKPDLIFLNIVMPGRDGFEAIKLLKADSQTKDIPVIFESNRSQPEDFAKGIELGAIDYLVLAYLTPIDFIKTALDYFNGSDKYIKRYPIFLEASETNFPGKNDKEKAENRGKFIDAKMLANL